MRTPRGLTQTTHSALTTPSFADQPTQKMHLLTDYGEEWLNKTDLTGITGVDVGLYNDADDGADTGGDSISDTSDLPINSEPSDGNYTRQTGQAITVEDIGGDWGFDNDDPIQFDTSSTTGTVDSWFVVYAFTSDQDTDGTVDHLIATGGLSQAYDLSNVDQLDISAGDGSGNGVGITVT